MARATKATTQRPSNNTAPLALATDVDNPTREFSGTIRRARVYARALSAADLASDSRGPGDDGVRFWFDAATVGLTEKRPRDKTFYAYGGDWGDNPNDGNFAGDGIVTADRRPTGKAAEVKRIYQAISVSAGADVTAGSSRSPTSTSSPTSANSTAGGSWSPTATVVQSGALTARAARRRAVVEQDHHLPFSCRTAPAPGAEYFLELSFTTSRPPSLGRRGLRGGPATARPSTSGSPRRRARAAGAASRRSRSRGRRPSVTVTGTGFSVTVAKATGVDQLVRGERRPAGQLRARPELLARAHRQRPGQRPAQPQRDLARRRHRTGR